MDLSKAKRARSGDVEPEDAPPTKRRRDAKGEQGEEMETDTPSEVQPSTNLVANELETLSEPDIVMTTDPGSGTDLDWGTKLGLNKDPNKWSPDDVKAWTKAIFESVPYFAGLAEKLSTALKDDYVDGGALLDLNYERLTDKTGNYCFPGGHANRLLKAIESLKNPPPGQLQTQGIPLVRSQPHLLLEIQFKDICWPETGGTDPKVKSAFLPGGWYTLESNNLFVRQCYETLWTEVRDAYNDQKNNRRVLILGNPGIGKTASLNYLLLCALKDGIRVLFESRSTRFLFDGQTVRRELIQHTALADEVYEDRSVLVLHDHQPGHEPPQLQGAFVVAALSPDQRNYNEFQKHLAKTIWLPLPSKSELIAMNSVEPHLDEATFESRFSEYGPIPRLLFSPHQKKVKRELTAKIADFEFGPAALSMLRTKELRDGGKVSWWIFHVDATPDLSDVSEVRWVSDDIRKRVLQLTQASKIGQIECYLADFLLLRLKTPLHPLKNINIGQR